MHRAVRRTSILARAFMRSSLCAVALAIRRLRNVESIEVGAKQLRLGLFSLGTADPPKTEVKTRVIRQHVFVDL